MVTSRFFLVRLEAGLPVGPPCARAERTRRSSSGLHFLFFPRTCCVRSIVSSSMIVQSASQVRIYLAGQVFCYPLAGINLMQIFHRYSAGTPEFNSDTRTIWVHFGFQPSAFMISESPPTLPSLAEESAGAFVAIQLLAIRAGAATHPVVRADDRYRPRRGLWHRKSGAFTQRAGGSHGASRKHPAFLDWVGERTGRENYPAVVAAGDFIPRWIYGEYIRARSWSKRKVMPRSAVEMERGSKVKSWTSEEEEEGVAFAAVMGARLRRIASFSPLEIYPVNTR